MNIRLDRIATADTDEVIGGAIPEEGFTLRLIGGGLGATATCSRCPWLQHCEGKPRFHSAAPPTSSMQVACNLLPAY